jgi:magnesium transporter
MIRILATKADKDAPIDVALADLPAWLADEGAFVWVDLSGGPDAEAESVVRDTFRFHALAIEDCFEAREHPKIEPFDEYVYLITHGIWKGSTAEEADVVELDVFLGKRYLVTYHAKESRSVDLVRDAILRGGGLLRRGPAAVLHALLDRQVEGIEPILDDIEQAVEDLEDRMFSRPRRRDLESLLALKRTTLQFRRWMSKQREVVLRLARNEFALVSPQEALLFRDVYDHLARFTDLVENHREMITSLRETHLSVTNLRLGEIMKFLTLFTAVLMPLTVITGIYGMNFEHMPELRTPWAYPAVLGVMLATGLGIAWYFRRKGWIGKDEPIVLPSARKRR